MMILSMLPAASAFAATAPTVTLTEVGHSTVADHVSVGSSVVFTASSTVSNARYQFWVESPNGTWTATGGYSSNNSYTLTASQSGDYLVTAYALSSSQLATGDYAAATNVGSNGLQQVDGVFVNSHVALSVPSASVVAGHHFTISATASNIYDAQYQFWYKSPSGSWQQSGNYSSSSSFTFTPSQSGTYQFIAYAKSPLALNDPQGADYSAVQSGTVEPVVNIGLNESASTMPNNGTSSDTFTAVVTDANGNPMSGVSVTFTSSNSGVVAFASGATSTTASTNASGIATGTGTAGTSVGSAVVTAQADSQHSSPITVSTTQGPATQVGHFAVSPVVGSVASQTVNNGKTTTTTTYIGTAGKAETLSATVEDAQGNPVPSQTIVLRGNHVNTNTGVSGTDSIQLPNSSTFTSFSSSEFGLAKSSASGVVTFTVDNSANAVSGDMTVPSGDQVSYSGSTLPFNTYSYYLVPTSTTVTEGQALPSNLVALSGNANNSGQVQVAWEPATAQSTAIGIEATSNPTGTTMPTTYNSGDATASVTTAVSAPEFYSVKPYINHTTSNTAITLSSPVSVGSGISYTLTASGSGRIDSIDGVSLQGINGNGWTESTSGVWTDTSSGGTNYAAATEHVTIKYVAVTTNGAVSVVPEILVSNANVSTPLELTGANSVNSSVAQPNVTGYAQQTSNTKLTFGVNQTSIGTTSVSVTASSTTTSPTISSPSAATAVDMVTSQVLSTSDVASFAPSTLYTNNLNGTTTTDTMTVTDANGNPVVGAAVTLDGGISTSSGGVTAGSAITSSLSAVWVTAVDGHTLTGTLSNGTAANDPFPMVENTSSATSLSGEYSAPAPINGVAYTNGNGLVVTTNANGQVTLSLAGEVNYVNQSGTVSTSSPLSTMSSATYYVSAWDAAAQYNIGHATVQSEPTSSAQYLGISPTAYSPKMGSSDTVTIQTVNAAGNPVSASVPIVLPTGDTNVWLTGINGTSLTETLSSGLSAPTPVPLYSGVTTLGYSGKDVVATGLTVSGISSGTATPSVMVTTNNDGLATMTLQAGGVPYWNGTKVVRANVTSGSTATFSYSPIGNDLSASSAYSYPPTFRWSY